MLSGLTGLCPLLGEDCDRVNKNPKDVETTIALIDDDKASIVEIDKKIDDTNERVKDLYKSRSTVSSLKSTIRSSNTDDLDDCREEVDKIVKSISKLRKELDSISVHQSDLDRLDELDDEIDEADQLKSDAAQSLGRIKAKIESKEVNLKRVDELSSEIASQEESLMMWNYIARMFSKSGIPSHELEQEFAVIEDEINFVLGELQANTSVSMASHRELKKWEDVCIGCGADWKEKNARSKNCTICGISRAKKRKEEFTLTFEDDKANEDSFDMDSGGGKVLKSIGVRIALSLLKMRSTPDPLSILILDECFGELDSVNQEMVLQVVTSVATRLGFSQVFIITHTSIKDSFHDTLLVTRSEYYSEVSWR